MGVLDVDQVLALPLDKFRGWQAYYWLFPWEAERGNRLLAELCSMFWNAHRGKNATATRSEDFHPDRRKPPRARQTIGQMKLVCKALAGINFGDKRV